MSAHKGKGATYYNSQGNQQSKKGSGKPPLKPPVIFVHNINDFTTLYRTVAKAIYPNKCRKEEANRLCPDDLVGYRKMIRYLLAKRVDYDVMEHGYEPLVIVVRNIPPDTPTQDIKEELTEQGFKVRKVINAIHPRYRVPIPLFFIYLEDEEKSKELYKIQKLAHTIIKVEKFQPKLCPPSYYKGTCLVSSAPTKNGKVPVSNKVTKTEKEKTDTMKTDENHNATQNKIKSDNMNKQGICSKLKAANDNKTTNCQKTSTNNDNLKGKEIAKDSGNQKTVKANADKSTEKVPLDSQNVDINLPKSESETVYGGLLENTVIDYGPLSFFSSVTPERESSEINTNPWKDAEGLNGMDYHKELYESTEDITNTPEELRDMAFWPKLMNNVNDTRTNSSPTRIIQTNPKGETYMNSLFPNSPQTNGCKSSHMNMNNIDQRKDIWKMNYNDVFKNDIFDSGRSMLSSTHNNTRGVRVTDCNYLPIYQISTNTSEPTLNPKIETEIDFNKEEIHNLCSKSSNSPNEVHMPIKKEGFKKTVGTSNNTSSGASNNSGLGASNETSHNTLNYLGLGSSNEASPGASNDSDQGASNVTNHGISNYTSRVALSNLGSGASNYLNQGVWNNVGTGTLSNISLAREVSAKSKLRRSKMEEGNPLISIDVTLKGYYDLYEFVFDTDRGEALKYFVQGWRHAYYS